MTFFTKSYAMDLNEKLLTLHLNVGGEKIKVNLLKELKLVRPTLSISLRHQPSHYAFIGMAHRSLLAELQAAELDLKRITSRVFLKYAGSMNPTTGRSYSNEMAREKTNISPKVIKAEDKVLEIRANVQKLELALRAFEQKKDIMQTLSANIRKEKEI